MADHRNGRRFSPTATAQELFRARAFEEPLVPVGSEPTPHENAALAQALTAYANRTGPDDFVGLTSFLDTYPTGPWTVALLTNLGLEYFNTGHYSKALEAWRQASERGTKVSEPRGRAIADRAMGELAHMYARLGRVTELEALLTSVEGRAFSGPATERITGAREGLWNMKNRPETAFRCGPFALHRIQLATDPANPGTELIHACAATQRGYSLVQVQELSQELGLGFQMAIRTHGAAFVVPSVVHFTLDHFAAITRQDGERYLLQDPTFGNDLWVTGQALDGESSGYFLVPAGPLPQGWRAVEAAEGEHVWGRGTTGDNEPGPHAPGDPATPLPGGKACPKGMAVSRVHLMLVSLNINDEPVGYAPPVGPAVRFVVRYNQRDAFQPSNFAYSNLGPKWTFDWLSYITGSAGSNATYYVMGGGTRTFTDLDFLTKRYRFQLFDQTQLIRTSQDSFEMVSRDGSRKIFSQPDGTVGATQKIFLTQIVDPHGNALLLTYDDHLRLATITDAIGQITKLSYADEPDIFKIIAVSDPFGRTASFRYDDAGRLVSIRDSLGLTSDFTYDADGALGSKSDFIVTLKTVYGETSFTKTEQPGNVQRSLETRYPDGERERVEFNQSDKLGIADSDPPQNVPAGMSTINRLLSARNTYYWDKLGCASAYRDYTKAKIHHWLHSRANPNFTSGILESIKAPLEGRVWFDYAGQAAGPAVDGTSNQPTHVGRVLEDGSTQLHTYDYNGFGQVITQVDPLGRTVSYLYAANGIDLLETHQTRAGRKELLTSTTYNAQHQPLTSTDAAGQTTTCVYEPSRGEPHARGQILSMRNARGETTSCVYDDHGRLTSIEGPLPGSSTTLTYDALSRMRTRTDESGHTLSFEYDAFDRLTKVAFPNGSSEAFSFDRLDHVATRDRAGRQTTFKYNTIRQLIERTDPLGRSTRFQWCTCGSLKTFTDAMGRTTTWRYDLQGRLKRKAYVGGGTVAYRYERASGRLSQKIDEQLQVTQYDYNRDDSVNRISYNNATVETPPVSFTYDEEYQRLRSLTDGSGTTRYSYFPIELAPAPGAGLLARVAGPRADDVLAFTYDELGRRATTTVNGATSSVAYDAAGRVASSENAMGVFTNTYDGHSSRRLSQTCPNGLTTAFGYADVLRDRRLERITNTRDSGAISDFSCTHDASTGQITSWTQQAGADTASVFEFTADLADQLITASVTAGGNVVGAFSYSYDLAGNRTAEQADGVTRQFSYNALNELTAVSGSGEVAATYQWDAAQRLRSVQSGAQRTEFAYDGLGRRVGIRALRDGVEVSNRRFVWCANELCEERSSDGALVKRFFHQGMTIESGNARGSYFYTRDHLGSIREITDGAGRVRARYAYEPFGRRTRLSGDIDADVGFAGMFHTSDPDLALTLFRAYDPGLARWLSRDVLPDSEFQQDQNLYAYVRNNPIRHMDPLGLCCEAEAINVDFAQKALETYFIWMQLGVATAAAAYGAAVYFSRGALVAMLSANAIRAAASLAFLAALEKLYADLDGKQNDVARARALLDACAAKGCRIGSDRDPCAP